MKVQIDKFDREQSSLLANVLPTEHHEQRVLRHCVSLSYVLYRGTVEGNTACIWGLIPPTLLSIQAYLWLYTTDVIKDNQFLFVRHSQRMMESMLDEYPTITGHAAWGQVHSIRWLKWLGAEFGDYQEKLIPFVIRKKKWLTQVQ